MRPYLNDLSPETPSLPNADPWRALTPNPSLPNADPWGTLKTPKP